MRIFFVLVLIFIFSNNTFAGVSDAQRRVIDNQLFLLKEGMVTSEKVFEKAKKFDDKGIFGIGSDEMSKDEFKNYLKEKNFTIHD